MENNKVKAVKVVSQSLEEQEKKARRWETNKYGKKTGIKRVRFQTYL